MLCMFHAESLSIHSESLFYQDMSDVFSLASTANKVAQARYQTYAVQSLNWVQSAIS